MTSSHSKIVSVFLLGLVFLSSLSFSSPQRLELELSSQEYARLIAKQKLREDSLTPIFAMGKRLLDWIIVINKPLPENDKFSLYSPGTETAYPIESPRFSNLTIIADIFTDLKSKLPDWMSDVVLEGGELTEKLPVSEEEFRKWGIEIDRLYQRAARWKLQEPNLLEYADEKKNDIRGYYFLSKVPSLQEKLENWEDLTEKEQAQYREWLTGMCFNSGASESSCSNQVKSLEKTPEKLYPFYQKYFKVGKKLWDDAFVLGGKRNDVEWTSKTPDLMTVPFRTPSIAVIKDFLEKHIEDEWKWKGWQLKLDFTSNAQSRIEFVPGSTPHVNGIAGNIITMDANAPLTEYDVQWTIRHEYGHVLGFTDCYVEFYDTKLKTMISYQLDISDLMCSRKGKLKQNHYDELKKNYFDK